MGQATVYCDKCQEMIAQTDFAKGKAVLFEGKNYCPNCKGEISHLLPGSGGTQPGSGVSKTPSGVMKNPHTPITPVRRMSGVFQSSGVHKGNTSGVTKRSASGIRKAVSAEVKAATPQEGSRPIGESHGSHARIDTRARKKGPGNKNTVMIACIIGAVVVVGIVVAVIVSNNARKQAEIQREQERHAKAKDALDQIRRLFNGLANDFDPLLATIAEKRPLLDGESGMALELTQIEGKVRERRDAFLAQKAREDTLARILKDAEARPGDYQKFLSQLADLRKATPELNEEFLSRIVAATKDLTQKGLRDTVAQIEKSIQDGKPPFKDQIDKLLALLDQAEGMPDLTKQIHSAIDSAKKADAERFREEFEALRDSVNKLVENKEYDQALQKIDNISEDLKEGPFYPDILRLRTSVIERRANRGSGGGNNAGGNNGGGQDPVTPAGQTVVLFNGEDLGGWSQRNTQYGAWSVDPVEKTLIGENKEPGLAAGQNGSKALAIMKGENWADLDLMFEMKVTKGTLVLILARIGSSGNSSVTLTIPQASLGSWQKFRFEYRGRNLTICDLGNGAKNTLELAANDPPAGLIGFAVCEGTRAEFRKIEVTPR